MPLFQVWFVVQEEMGSVGLTGVDSEGMKLESKLARYPLRLDIHLQRRKEMETVWEYQTRWHEASRIRRLARHWKEVLRLVVGEPELRLSAILHHLKQADEQLRIQEEAELQEYSGLALRPLKRTLGRGESHEYTREYFPEA